MPRLSLAYPIYYETQPELGKMIYAEHWFETIRLGDDVTLTYGPCIGPPFRCNKLHVREPDRDTRLDAVWRR